MTPENLVRRLIKTIKRLKIELEPEDIEFILNDRRCLINYNIPLEENILLYVSRKDISDIEKDEVSMMFSKTIFNNDSYTDNFIDIIKLILESKYINKNLNIIIINNLINVAYSLSRIHSGTSGYNNPYSNRGNRILSFIYKYNTIRLAYSNMDNGCKSTTEMSVLNLIRKNNYYTYRSREDSMYLYFSMEDTIYKE